MYSIGQITKIFQITSGAKPQMGPILTIPFLIEVQTSGGPGVLEISQAAAQELVEELAKHLQARDSP
jgi:hypothetical protein